MKLIFFIIALVLSFIAAFIGLVAVEGQPWNRVHFGWAAFFFSLLSIAPFING